MMKTPSSPSKVNFAMDNRTNRVLESIHSIPRVEDPALKEELFYQPLELSLFRREASLAKKYKRCYDSMENERNISVAPSTKQSSSPATSQARQHALSHQRRNCNVNYTLPPSLYVPRRRQSTPPKSPSMARQYVGNQKQAQRLVTTSITVTKSCDNAVKKDRVCWYKAVPARKRMITTTTTTTFSH